MMVEINAFDFHIHSCHSYDSICSTRAIQKAAKRRHLKGYAITDHNTLKGAFKASSYDSEMIVVIGEEISTNKGDIIGLFLNEEVKPGDFLEVIDRIREQDGLVILPHPFKKNLAPSPDVVSNIDIVEVLNGRRSAELNRMALSLAEKHNLPPIGGSDAHLACEIGRVQTIFHEEIVDQDDIRYQLMQQKVTIVGMESSKFIHYPSVLIGSIRTRNFNKIVKSIHKKIFARVN